METQIQEDDGVEVMHVVYETGGIWEIRTDYKERDTQESDNDTSMLTKLKKENQLIKTLPYDANAIS